MSRVAFHTLGCKLNMTETATIARQFTGRGFDVVEFDKPVDVIVLNTCSVTEKADRECRQLVRRALRNSPNAYVIVLGCYAQLKPEEIAAINGVDLVLGAQEKFDIFRHATMRKEHRARVIVGAIADAQTFYGADSTDSDGRTRAFLKVQDGCDYHCTFCTIPLARGKSRSVSITEAVQQATHIAEQGFREIVLTGVNVGDFGSGDGSSFLELLKSLDEVEGITRIRVSSVEPNLLSEEIIRYWMTSEKMCHHFHIPLQSGSDAVLRLMRRRYTRAFYESRIQLIKTYDSRTCIGADVIAGFPGETNEAFEDSYRFLVDQPLSYLHVFSYSERDNTIAAGLGEHVARHIRHDRNERMRILSEKKRRAFVSLFVGDRVSVLFERPEEELVQTGLTKEYVRVRVYGENKLEGLVRTVRITGLTNGICSGELEGKTSLRFETASKERIYA